jgi:hypothetical protein
LPKGSQTSTLLRAIQTAATAATTGVNAAVNKTLEGVVGIEETTKAKAEKDQPTVAKAAKRGEPNSSNEFEQTADSSNPL